MIALRRRADRLLENPIGVLIPKDLGHVVHPIHFVELLAGEARHFQQVVAIEEDAAHQVAIRLHGKHMPEAEQVADLVRGNGSQGNAGFIGADERAVVASADMVEEHAGIIRLVQVANVDLVGLTKHRFTGINKRNGVDESHGGVVA